MWTGDVFTPEGRVPNVPIGLVLFVGSCAPVLGQWQAWSRTSLAAARSLNLIYLHLSAYFRAKCGPGTCLLRKGTFPNVPIGLVLLVGSCPPVLGQWQAWSRHSLADGRSVNFIYLLLSAYFRAKCGPRTCLLRKGASPECSHWLSSLRWVMRASFRTMESLVTH